MKLTRTFFILLCLLFVLCTILYSLQKNFIQEGLTGDDPVSLAEAQKFDNDRKYGNKASYIKILPLKNFVLSSNNNEGIAAAYPNLSSLPICQYTVKSSYNSACSGSSGNISNEMLKYVLSRGCRFIDLEIANVSGVPYVVSPNYNSVVSIDTTKIVPLSNILQTAVTYGITNSPGSAPNYSDPLFVHMRIHPDPSYNLIYQDIASSIQQNIGSNLYQHPTIKSGFVPTVDIEPFTTNKPNKVVTTNKPTATPTTNSTNNRIDINKTKMSDIMGKVIILLDNNYDPNWRTKSKCDSKKKNCYDLNNFVHIETGIETATINSPTTILNQSKIPINIGNDGISSMNQNLQFIFPDSDMAILNQTKGSNASKTSNPDFTNIMLNWSCNFITNCFYKQDNNLRAYEDFFNEQQTAIVPFSYVKNYYTQQQIDNTIQ
jgi:hypothetical protein